MTKMKNFRPTLHSLFIFFAFFLSGCGGTYKSQFIFNEKFIENKPVKGEKCFDAAVLLSLGLENSIPCLKDIVANINSTVTSFSSNDMGAELKAQRKRGGFVQGGGGEELSVNLIKIDCNRTFVTVTTKTGFRGGMNMIPWSCFVVDKLVQKTKNQALRAKENCPGIKK